MAKLLLLLVMLFLIGSVEVSAQATQLPGFSTTGSGCTYSWNVQVDTNVFGGQRTDDDTLGACQQTCIATTNCDGVDWNAAAGSGQKCWQSGPWSTGWNQVAGIQHYSLTRTCPTTTTSATSGCLLDLVFILDSSGSIGSSDWNRMLGFINNIIGRLTVSPNGIHVGVIVFSDTASVSFYLTQYLTTAGVQSSVSSLTYIGGGTSFYSGLSLALSDVFTTARGMRNNVIKVALLVTDGQDSNSAAVTKAQELRDAGIRVMALGIGNSVDSNNLLNIVITTNNLFSASDFTQLSDTLAAILTTASCQPSGQRCNGSMCEKSSCNADQACCYCECVKHSLMHTCQCCPPAHHCCPYTPTYSGFPLAVCCPIGTDCVRSRETYVCLTNDIEPLTTTPVCEVCDQMYLSVTANRSFELYLDGRPATSLTGLPFASTWNTADTFIIPADTEVIAVRGFGTTSGRSGLLASVTHNYLLTNESWKCSSSASSAWYDITFNDASWPSATPTGVSVGIPRISPAANWIWTANSIGPSNLDTPVYCRKKFPTDLCNVPYGNCSNLCAKKNMVCCNCQMGKYGPTKVCTCCPRGYHCCFNEIECKDTCCPDGFECIAGGKCSSSNYTIPAELKCGPCEKCCNETPSVCPIDLTFVIDSSESIPDSDLNSLYKFIENIILGLVISPTDTQVAAISFSNAAKVQFYLNTYQTKATLISAIRNMQYDLGITNLYAGLRLLIFPSSLVSSTFPQPDLVVQHYDSIYNSGRGARPINTASRVAIIISDGADNLQNIYTEAMATELKSNNNNNIRLMAVGVTNAIDRMKLRNIVSEPKFQNYYEVTDYPALGIATAMADRIRSRACSNLPEDCYESWNVTNNLHAISSKQISQATTVQMCKQSCIAYDKCVGFDWNNDPAVSDNEKCWLSGPWNTDGLQQIPNIDHYARIQICCTNTWTIQSNSKVAGSTVLAVRTIFDCQSACIADDTCVGLDWNPGSSNADEQCWLSTNNNISPQTGVSHYSLSRTYCRMSAQTDAPTNPSSPLSMSTTQSNQPGCSWLTVPQTNYFGGIQASSANTEAACKTACIRYSGCNGCDFNAVATDGLKCWLSGSWSTGSSNQSPGITHFELTRGPGCA